MKYEEPNMQILVIAQNDLVLTSLDPDHPMPGDGEDTGKW